MRINVAKSAGFCFGVREAVEIALDTVSKPGPSVHMLGDIVHNEQVVDRISKSGIKVTGSLEEITEGRLLIRAHGAKKGLAEEATKGGLEVIDATCPMVTEIHKDVEKLEAQGCEIVIIGDHGHDEVIGIASHVKEHVRIIATREEVGKAFPRRVKRLGVVVQSTQNIENVQAIMTELVLHAREIHFLNTICEPTIQHQRDIRTMPKENDVMIIIGSQTSANTMRLVSISKNINPRSYHVQSPDDLNPMWFAGASSIGIHAGASTPDWLIEEVVEKIKSFDPQETSVCWERHVMGQWPQKGSRLSPG